MAKQYGSKNKGFQKSSDNRRQAKVESLLSKARKHRKSNGPELTSKETEYLRANGPSWLSL